MTHWPGLKGRAEPVEGSLRMSQALSSCLLRRQAQAIRAWDRSHHHGSAPLSHFLLRIIQSRDASDQRTGQLDARDLRRPRANALAGVGQTTV